MLYAYETGRDSKPVKVCQNARASSCQMGRDGYIICPYMSVERGAGGASALAK